MWWTHKYTQTGVKKKKKKATKQTVVMSCPQWPTGSLESKPVLHCLASWTQEDKVKEGKREKQEQAKSTQGTDATAREVDELRRTENNRKDSHAEGI